MFLVPPEYTARTCELLLQLKSDHDTYVQVQRVLPVDIVATWASKKHLTDVLHFRETALVIQLPEGDDS